MTVISVLGYIIKHSKFREQHKRLAGFYSVGQLMFLLKFHLLSKAKQ